MRGTVESEWMVVALDAEDDIVGGKVDFDHDVFGGELLEKLVRVILIHDVDTVADALGVAEIHCLTDVELQTMGRNHSGS